MIPSGSIVHDQVGWETKLRCDKGYQLWLSGEYDLVIVTGGIAEAPDLQSIPGSTIMKEYLISLGIHGYAILEENEALDTYENASFSLDLLKKLGADNFGITVVTQWQHSIRFFIAFLFGSHTLVKLKPIRYKMTFWYWCKEWLFILYHLYDWKGIKSLARINRDNRRRT